MILLLLASNLFLVLLLYVLRRDSQNITRERERERNSWMQMLREVNDRLMHAQGNTWTPPPTSEIQQEMTEEEKEAFLAELKRREEGWVQM